MELLAQIKETTTRFGPTISIYVDGKCIASYSERNGSESADYVYFKKLLANGLLKCEICGIRDKTVSIQACGYSEDVHGEQVLETICDKCEHEHLMDI